MHDIQSSALGNCANGKRQRPPHLAGGKRKSLRIYGARCGQDNILSSNDDSPRRSDNFEATASQSKHGVFARWRIQLSTSCIRSAWCRSLGKTKRKRPGNRQSSSARAGSACSAKEMDCLDAGSRKWPSQSCSPPRNLAAPAPRTHLALCRLALCRVCRPSSFFSLLLCCLLLPSSVHAADHVRCCHRCSTRNSYRLHREDVNKVLQDFHLAT